MLLRSFFDYILRTVLGALVGVAYRPARLT